MEVAPLIFVNVLLSVDDCHWYDKVPVETDAETDKDALPFTSTDFPLGCVLITGVGVALTSTETELEYETFETPSFVAVATQR